MNQNSSVIRAGGTAEIAEKRSRFIAGVFPVKTEQEALNIIGSVKKQYWDASHNCYAYVIGEENRVERCSDDGEPARTAGRPILEVILGAGIKDALIVVTRYFGGTLLGTGGLIRAYTKAAQEGLRSSIIITRIKGYKLKLRAEYTEIGKLQYLLQQNQIPVLHTEYGESVEIDVVVSDAEKDAFISLVIEETNGNIEPEVTSPCCFAVIDGGAELLE